MSREKQIEEMLNEICVNCTYLLVCEDEHLKQACRFAKMTNVLYNAGYRKQSVGEWEKVMNHRECSKCGYKAPYKKIKAGYHLQDLSKYCPNCGVKMKGG